MARLLGLAPFAACQRNIRRVYDRSPDDAHCERGFRGKFATDWTKLHLLAVDMKSNAKDPEMNLRSGFANAGVPRNRAGGETGTIRELFRLPTGAARLR